MKALVDGHERRNADIAAFLHDDLLQLLNAAMLRLQLASRQADEGVSAEIDRAVEQLRVGAEHLAALEMGLRPPALDNHDLAGALADLFAARLGARRGSLTITGEIDLGETTELGVFRLIQQMATWVASTATVRLAVTIAVGEDRVISIEMALDGGDVGMPHHLTQTIRARVAALDGAVEAVSPTIVARIPTGARRPPPPGT